MEILKIPYAQVPQLSAKDLAYVTADPRLRPFYKYDVSLEAFAQVIEDKKKNATNRAVLVEVLKEQYQLYDTTDQVWKNIESLLNENTFTVTTAHQPVLFTGPLFYLYKIISTINLAEQLNKHYTDYHFVPFFINGGEDHDFEEVNHATVFSKKVEWQSGESGPVGRMHTASLTEVLQELKQILGDSENAQQVYNIIEKAYTKQEFYGLATIHIVNELFKNYGLVALGTNRVLLKQLFMPIMEQELLHQPSQGLVEATQAELEKAGFSSQAHVREINLFYLREQLRERIVRQRDTYKVLNTDYVFTKEEILAELHEHPEHFSPNVVLRPIYQELILPNLAYIGGGGEISYWLERMSQFVHFGLNFPMLIRRNSVLWLDGGSVNKLQKLDLDVMDLFEETEILIKHYITKNSDGELSLAEEKSALEKLFQTIAEKAKAIDPTLEKAVLAEGAKQIKNVEQIESRLVKAEKQKHETALNQIRSLRDKLFPGNGLQERVDNFMPFYVKYGQEFLHTLKENLNPLEKDFIVVLDK
jgi:bacillithiol biosynthesis cysteine-adding enzyme BshC